MERVSFKGWDNCIRLTNGNAELVVTADVGPRIVHFALAGGENQFRLFDPMLGKKGGAEYRILGGHRLWHIPEDPVRTYVPDNEPVAVQEIDNGVRLTQPVEVLTGIQKEMEIVMAPGSSRVTVTHRLHNRSQWDIETAPWALSIMREGGRAFLPLPPRGSHPRELKPNSSLILWPYTDMSDARWTWGKKYVVLRQDPAVRAAQKIGVKVTDGWGAYLREGTLFVKRVAYRTEAEYPDMGSTFELFTVHVMLEFETLGVVSRVHPGQSTEHTELWQLFDGVKEPRTEEEIDEEIARRAGEVSFGGE